MNIFAIPCYKRPSDPSSASEFELIYGDVVGKQLPTPTRPLRGPCALCNLNRRSVTGPWVNGSCLRGPVLDFETPFQFTILHFSLLVMLHFFMARDSGDNFLTQGRRDGCARSHLVCVQHAVEGACACSDAYRTSRMAKKTERSGIQQCFSDGHCRCSVDGD